MFQVRIHGRGGQGVVTAAELLSVAAFLEGKQAQAFPSFGPERSGAPVVAFCRIDDRPIRLHEPIVEADAVIVQDTTLLHGVDLFAGLLPGGFVLLDSKKSVAALGIGSLADRLPPGHVQVVDAGSVALQHLGKPIANVALLGCFAALTGVVGIEAVLQAIASRFAGKVRAGNVAAARAAYGLAGGTP
jgi:pyruvate ferredoxin oxidoreductase gamma subunit